MSASSPANPAFGSVAIVGIGGIYPDAPDLDRFWKNILSGHSAAREVPPDRWAVSADSAFSDEIAAKDKVYYPFTLDFKDTAATCVTSFDANLAPLPAHCTKP